MSRTWEGSGTVAHAWLPEAVRIRAEADGGALGGGAPRAVWLTLGSPANAVSVQSAGQRLVADHRPCHLVWNPSTGEIAQLISVLRAGRALGAPDRLDWTPVRIQPRTANVNAEGRVCVQIGVLAVAAEPFTSGPLIGVETIMSWLDSWGVSRRWPAGPPGGWADHGRARGVVGAVGAVGSVGAVGAVGAVGGRWSFWGGRGRGRGGRGEPRGVGARRALRRVAGPRVRSRRAGGDRHSPAHRQRAARTGGAEPGSADPVRRRRATDPGLSSLSAASMACCRSR